MYNQNIKELIETYMSHPMFDETPNIKQFFDIILSGRNLLNYTLTKSGHFLDDYANIRTCYLSSLIQTLKMMGEDIYEYEKGAFEGVNELRDFVRILTMNHSDLVGHLVDDDVDTTIRADKFGKNIGDEIFVDDVLTLQQSDQQSVGAFNKGKILKLTRDGKVYNMNEIHPNGVDIIVHDKYTNETKVVNLRSINKGSVSLFEYDHSWGWNLLLPQDFDDCVYRLKQNSEYAAAHNGTNLYKTSELNRIKQVMKEILRGYYAFYVLNPNVQKVRKGNFLDENTITSVMDDSEEWESNWGFTHDVLMKIIRDNGNLINSEVDVEVDENLQRSYGRKTISFDSSSLTGLVETELSNIQTYVYDDGFLTNDAIVNGIVNVYGYICGFSEEYLEIQLENASVEVENSMEQLKTIEPILQLKLKIDENGVIHPSKHVFEVFSKNYTGNLTISLCGKLEKIKDTLKGFLWSVSIDLFKIK